jgi:endonuclease/exonuclease/phosphatase family metal-dependent hydrolase
MSCLGEGWRDGRQRREQVGEEVHQRQQATGSEHAKQPACAPANPSKTRHCRTGRRPPPPLDHCILDGISVERRRVLRDVGRWC